MVRTAPLFLGRFPMRRRRQSFALLGSSFTFPDTRAFGRDVLPSRFLSAGSEHLRDARAAVERNRASADAVAVLGGNPDGRPWCEAPRGDAFERGDAAVWHALAVLACRGLRALVVRTDGAGEATARRVAVRPHDEAVSHAMGAVYGVAERGWRGKRGRPATYGALVAMLRAIVRRQIDAMHRVRSRFDERAADQRELDALAGRDDRARNDAARDAARAYAEAVARLSASEREAAERAAERWSVHKGSAPLTATERKDLARARKKLAIAAAFRG